MRPERNREVDVLIVNDVLHGGDLYNCFDISLQMDVRDAMVTGRCRAVLVSEHEVLVTYPALQYPMFIDSVMRNKRLVHLKTLCAQLQQAQDIWVNEMKRDPQRNEKRLLLRFPHDVVLGNVFVPNSYELKMSIPIDNSVYAPIPNARLISAQLQWRIADINTHREATIATNETDVAFDVIAQFARMYPTGDA